MYYLFATSEESGEIETLDCLLSRDESKSRLLITARRVNAIDTYIMNDADIVVWQSWE